VSSPVDVPLLPGSRSRRLASISQQFPTPLTAVSRLPCSQSQSHIETDGQSVSKSWCRAPSGAHDQILITCVTVTVLFLWSAVSDDRMGLSFVDTAGPCLAQSFSGPFYCLLFETSLFVAFYDSQGHGGGIRPRLHTGITAAEQSRAEQSRSLLLAISRHGHSWHRVPVGPVAIYLLLV
jgi:hypothetical protein